MEQAQAAGGPVLLFHCEATSTNCPQVRQSEGGFHQRRETLTSGRSSRCGRSKRDLECA